MAATVLKTKVQLDPKRKAILDKLGDLSHLRIAQNEFLMAIYIRSNMSPGGILMTDKTVKEDVYQGKVGLVVKIGSNCHFTRNDAETGRTYGIDVNLYDWVVARPGENWAIDINGDPNASKRDDFVTCRLAYDDSVRMVLDNPDCVW